jgi:hypothetical protein
MGKWDTVRQQHRVAEISRELGRLFRAQTDFFSKGHEYSVQELREYELTCERVRELVTEFEGPQEGSVNACCQL